MLIISCSAFAQNFTGISGVITSNKLQQVAGAGITLLNTNYSAISNVKGEFRINGVPEGTYTMHISNIAYAEHNLTISISGKGQLINITLNDASKQLDEVVVIA
jgi:hypothetical protein